MGVATNLQPVARGNHLFDHQPHDGLLGLEVRVVEPVAGLLDHGLGTGDLTYDTFGGSQTAPRDAEIDASGMACP